MNNPAVLTLLIALACATLIAGAVITARVFRRRAEEADKQREAARLSARGSEASLRRREEEANKRREAARLEAQAPTASRAPASIRPAAAPAASAPSYQHRPIQQPDAHDSGADLFNALMIQQALNNLGQEHEHYRENASGDESTRFSEYVPEPASYEAPVYAAPEPVSYTAPDPAPSCTESSPSYSDSGSFGGGDSGSF